MTTNNDNGKTHGQVFELLPWWINRTLSDDQHLLVKNHIADCVECQEEIRMLTVLNKEIELNNAAQYATKPDIEHDLSSVMQRIDVNTSTTESLAPGQGIIKKLLDMGSSLLFPRTPLQWGGSALAGLLVVLVGVQLWQSESDRNDDYNVLSASEPSDENIRLSVTFSSDLSLEDARTLVKKSSSAMTNELEVEEQQNGRYLVVLPSSVTVEMVNSLLVDLQNDLKVQQVEMLP